MSDMVDICFVGGGIACLYAAYEIMKIQPKCRFVVVERSTRLGGRAHSVDFHGVQILEGAGVGRFKKDRLLRSLMEELDIPVKKFRSPHVATFDQLDVLAIVKKLKQSAHKYDRHKTTFRQFATAELGDSTYKKFVESCGYSDFENADIIDTLEHYGFEDTTDQNLFSVPWNLLVERLAERIGKHNNNIILGSAVHGIKPNGDHYVVSHSGKSDSMPLLPIKCKHVVIGTTISSVRGLLPPHVNMSYFNHIQAQPFLRIYAKISSASDKFMQNIATYTVVKGDIQKIIPMNPQKGVYMIAYADNKHAVRLSEHAYDKAFLQQTLTRATGIRGIIIEDLYVKYWMEGTHYFTPLPKAFKTRSEFVKKAQRPLPNMFVIGEALSRRYQGWTQGALESVHAIIHNMLDQPE